jgi:hypothetical protein
MYVGEKGSNTGECTRGDRRHGYRRFMDLPWRLTTSAKPCAIKVASTVFQGSDEETGLCRPRIVATQLESGNLGSRPGRIALVVGRRQEFNNGLPSVLH